VDYRLTSLCHCLRADVCLYNVVLLKRNTGRSTPRKQNNVGFASCGLGDFLPSSCSMSLCSPACTATFQSHMKCRDLMICLVTLYTRRACGVESVTLGLPCRCPLSKAIESLSEGVSSPHGWRKNLVKHHSRGHMAYFEQASPLSQASSLGKVHDLLCRIVACSSLQSSPWVSFCLPRVIRVHCSFSRTPKAWQRERIVSLPLGTKAVLASSTTQDHPVHLIL
jgi:hypothetical protein